MVTTRLFVIALLACVIVPIAGSVLAAGSGGMPPAWDGMTGSPAAARSQADVAADDETPRLAPEVLNPEIGREELEIRLVPLTRAELAALAAQWHLLVRAKLEEVMQTQIDLFRAEGRTAKEIRSRLARLSEERRLLLDRFLVVLDGLEAKGGPEAAVMECRSYAHAVIEGTIAASDLEAVLSAIGFWLADKHGGLALAKKLAIALVSL